MKILIALWLILVGVSSATLASSYDHELSYGPNGGKIRLKKSSKYMGLKFFRNQDIEVANFKRKPNLGGFKIFKSSTLKDLDNVLDQCRQDKKVRLGTHVYHFEKDSSSLVVPTGSVYVEIKNNPRRIVSYTTRLDAFINKYGLKISSRRGQTSYILDVARFSNPIKTAECLQNMQWVKIAEPDLTSYVKKPALVPYQIAPLMETLSHTTIEEDVLMKAQWHLNNTGNHRGTKAGLEKGADARVMKAWKYMGNYGSNKIVVAVIDDGFDLFHPDLKNKSVSPKDFTRKNSSPHPGKGDWHGTACAGVAVGSKGGGDIIGVAPAAKLMPIRWGPDLSDEQVELWFDHATENGADIVSCSWGAASKYFPLSTRKFKAIENCATNGREGKGCVVVFAAGNDNHNINDPVGMTLDGFATHPNVIAVAASTSTDVRSNYSNFGKEISICAPSSGAGGMGILTADVTKRYGGDNYPGGYEPGDYDFGFGGTSSACPLVAGVCALTLSMNPNLTAAEVKKILQSTARRIGNGYDTNGHSILFGYGCVNALKAVKEAAIRLSYSESSEESSEYSEEEAASASSYRYSPSSRYYSPSYTTDEYDEKNRYYE